MAAGSAREDKEKIAEEISLVVTPKIEKRGLQLVDVEYLQDGGYWYVRVYIEYPDRDVSLEDCASISGDIEDDIDKIIDKKFFLEVSSPGIERPLKKSDDFKRFVGNNAKIVLKRKIDNIKEYEGKILSCDGNELMLLIADHEKKISLEDVKKANLIFDFDEIKEKR